MCYNCPKIWNKDCNGDKTMQTTGSLFERRETGLNYLQNMKLQYFCLKKFLHSKDYENIGNFVKTKLCKRK